VVVGNIEDMQRAFKPIVFEFLEAIRQIVANTSTRLRLQSIDIDLYRAILVDPYLAGKR